MRTGPATATSPSTGATPHERAREWRVHPAARRPWAALATLALIALTGFAAARVGGGAAWGAVAMAFLVLSVSSFLFPTVYRIDEQGVEVRHMGGTRRRAWRDVRRIQRLPGGLLLSPYLRPRLLDRFRAVLVRCEEGQEDLARVIESHRRPTSSASAPSLDAGQSP